MNLSFWTANQLVRVGRVVAVLLGAGWMVAAVNAGEAIQFSNANAKTRPEPGVQNRLAKEKLSSVDRNSSSGNPFDTVNPANPVLDDAKKPKTKEEKRRDLARVEDKNWVYVEKGQLQEEEEEKTAFGVRDYDVETAGKEKTTTDLWFSTKNNKNNNNGRSSVGNPRSPGAAARASASNRPRPAPASDETESGLKIRAGAKPGEQSVLGQSSGERPLQSFLAPESGAGKLNEIFNGPTGDQPLRGDLGLRSIDTSSGTRGLGLGGGDPLGFGRDLGAKPALSASPLLMDLPKAQPSSLFTPPGGPGFGLSGNRPLGDINSASRGGVGSTWLQPPPSSTLTPAPSDPFARPTRPSSGR